MKAPPLQPHRRGAPAPLPLYLGAVSASYGRAVSAAMALEPAPRTYVPPPGAPAVARAAAERLAALVAGIDAWRAAPIPPARLDAPAIWQLGSACLRPARPLPEGRLTAPPILVVPSLINGPHILDLDNEVSLLARLSEAGRTVVVMDWGIPGAAERGLDLTGYLTGRLLPAAQWLAREAGAPPDILGYCMGGTLCLPLAEAMLGAENRLCLIGAPWDFSAMGGAAEILCAAAMGTPGGDPGAALDALARSFGVIPRDVFQLLFALIDPLQAAGKFRRFAAMDPASAEAARFVAVEDWLNDGPPMAAPAARQLLVDWYCRNATAGGRWQVAGHAADPAKIAAKSLIVTGQKDHITPPETSLPLADLIPRARAHPTPFGHVGMIASPRAQDSVAGTVALFFSRTN